jgi:hypothetical protein
MFRRSFTERTVISSFALRSHPPADQGGFLLPLSLTAAFVLLLSSLSISAAALQAQQLHGAERSRQQARDELASAAHDLAAKLQGPYRCLLGVPSAQWPIAAQSSPCPAGINLQPLLSSSTSPHPVRLNKWQPDGTGSGGVLWLQSGSTGLQKRFDLNLTPGEGLREVG